MKKVLLPFFFAGSIISSVTGYASFVPTTPTKETSSASVPNGEVVPGASAPSREQVQDAMKDFNSLSRSEKKSKIKEFKKVIKTFKEDRKAGKDTDTNIILQVLIALFIPPLAVYLHEGETNSKFWISVLLTVLGLLIFGFAGILFLGTLPSIVYALIVILGNSK